MKDCPFCKSENTESKGRVSDSKLYRYGNCHDCGRRLYERVDGKPLNDFDFAEIAMLKKQRIENEANRMKSL